MVGLWLGGGEAVAQVFHSTRSADGKDTVKMADGGSDAQMADAAGAVGRGADGAGSPAGRAGSVASGDLRSHQDGSSADNGRDTRGGGIPAVDPDGAPAHRWGGAVALSAHVLQPAVPWDTRRRPRHE